MHWLKPRGLYHIPKSPIQKKEVQDLSHPMWILHTGIYSSSLSFNESWYFYCSILLPFSVQNKITALLGSRDFKNTSYHNMYQHGLSNSQKVLFQSLQEKLKERMVDWLKRKIIIWCRLAIFTVTWNYQPLLLLLWQLLAFHMSSRKILKNIQLQAHFHFLPEHIQP